MIDKSILSSTCYTIKFILWCSLYIFIFANIALNRVNGQDLLFLKNSKLDTATIAKYSSMFEYSLAESEANPKPMHYNNMVAALLNLNAPPDLLKNYVEKYINYDPVYACDDCFLRKYKLFRKENIAFSKELERQTFLKCKLVWQNLDSTLIKIITLCYENDQKFRSNPDDAPWISGNISKWKEQNLLDSINQIIISAIIDHNGYPNYHRVGVDLNEKVALIILHLDTKVQKKYLKIIKEQVDLGIIGSTKFAILQDKILMSEDKPQIYGTQLIFDDKREKLVLYKTQNITNLNAKRAEMDLGSIEEYLRRNNAEF